MNKYYLVFLGLIFFSCDNDIVYKCTGDARDIPTKNISELIDGFNNKLEINNETFVLKIDGNQIEVQNEKWVYQAFLNDLNLDELFYLPRKGKGFMVITIRTKNGQDNVSINSISNKTDKRIKDNHILISIYPESLGYEILGDLCEIFQLLKNRKH